MRFRIFIVLALALYFLTPSATAAGMFLTLDGTLTSMSRGADSGEIQVVNGEGSHRFRSLVTIDGLSATELAEWKQMSKQKGLHSFPNQEHVGKRVRVWFLKDGKIFAFYKLL